MFGKEEGDPHIKLLRVQTELATLLISSFWKSKSSDGALPHDGVIKILWKLQIE